jgi:hypothetical protein
VAGGGSEGSWFSVQTIVCESCKELHDAVVTFKRPLPPLEEPNLISTLKNRSPLKRLAGPGRAPRLSTLLHQLPPGGATDYRWFKFAPACPVSTKHRVKEWRNPGKCPKCGWFLDCSPLPFRTWD